MRAARCLPAAATVVLLVAWFLLLRPAFLGGPASYVMVDGASMEPTLHGGDLAVVRQQGAYGPGDIVAFRVPEGEPGEGATVIHRIVVGSAEEGFIVQGDNKERLDPWRPTGDDIVGKMWFHVPAVGRFLALLRAPLPLAALAGGLAILLVLSRAQKGKRARGAAPVVPSDAVPQPRRPRLGLWLLLVLMTRMATALPFTARRQGGGRHS